MPDRNRPDGFDVHAHRERLKLLKDDGSTSLWAGRGLDCPVCGAAVGRLFVTEERAHSFPGGAAFCVVNEPGRVLLFTHPERGREG